MAKGHGFGVVDALDAATFMVLVLGLGLIVVGIVLIEQDLGVVAMLLGLVCTLAAASTRNRIRKELRRHA